MNFQNIFTFRYQKTLLHTLLLLVFKIVESLPFSVSLKMLPVFEDIVFNQLNANVALIKKPVN